MKKTSSKKPGARERAGRRLLAKNESLSNDTRVTGLCNNDLIIGPTGAGKTRGYVKPNILQENGSMIITDTKGNLRQETGPFLKSRGYRVIDIDFTDLYYSKCGYNPLDYIRWYKDGNLNEQDVMTVAEALIPNRSDREPFWDDAAKLYASALLGYVMECLPKDEQNLNSVGILSRKIGCADLNTLFEELGDCETDSFAVARYQEVLAGAQADRTDSCIKLFLSSALLPYSNNGAQKFFSTTNGIDIASIGKEKTAVFLTVSDTDRSMDRLVSLFYTQALQVLIRTADRNDDCRLRVPVRLILDDFATNVVIPDFDRIISVIRSREISVSLIVQSLSQLNAMYGDSVKQTIVNNCDTWLYLGGQDQETVATISEKMNRPFVETAQMPLDKAALFIRGQAPRFVEKFDLTTHRNYRYLPEAAHTDCHHLSEAAGEEAKEMGL